MISLRQHVTSLVAVFLALAIGIVLGGGPFASGGDDDNGGDDTSTVRETSRPEPADDQTQTYADELVASGATRIFADGLNGHATAILTLPGTGSAEIKALQTQISAAGGAMTGVYPLNERLLDPDSEEDVGEVVANLVTQLADPRIDAEAPTYEQLGTLLALATATTQVSSVRADLAAVTIREALSTAGLFESQGDVRNAPLVLLALPSSDDTAPVSPDLRTLLTGVVNGIATNAAGVIVVGDSDSADDGGWLAALRDSELVGAISTVDGADTVLGQVTTVLAMIAVTAGTTGSFGASGADGVVPLL